MMKMSDWKQQAMFCNMFNQITVCVCIGVWACVAWFYERGIVIKMYINVL